MATAMNIRSEIKAISKMISAANSLVAVRQEVAKVMRDGFIVTDGRHHVAGKGFEVVVSCGTEHESVARRIRAAMPQMEIEHIATGVLGLRTARRVKKLE